MYDFDVIFLLIAQPASLRVGDMLGLHDCLAGSGMCTTVATSPTDLATIGKRLRIIVIDGEGDSDFDVYAVVAEMRQLDNVAIILLADETAMARERGLYAGADLCLPAWIAHADFFTSVIELASGQPLAASSRDERVALKRKRPRRRHYLGLHPRSRYYR